MNLHGRHFLKELDFTAAEWQYLIELARELKRERATGMERQRLIGKSIALIFEKTSTRTRCAFEVGAHEQGAYTTYLDPTSSQLGHKESVADTARVLGRMFHGIEYRGFGQQRVEELAAYAGVPVWNGLTDEWHPTQMLADQLTMLEHSPGKTLADIKLAYVGDARSNVGNSVLISGALMGMEVRIISPAELQPSPQVLDAATRLTGDNTAELHISDDLEAVSGVDFIYTDVWVSMGEPKELWRERLELLRPYQVNAALLRRSGNPDIKVLHCLPAYHDLDTEIGRQLHAETGMNEFEIAHDVFERHADIIFAQAENRMHTIKAVMVATLEDVPPSVSE
ncbi:MAG: ornithine carbamoyltransferase [Propionibacteriaceae bacterium]|jgi:ornithine carbamoyltransferase|nr:ornithine carbamoyltransferase [Propionibacteriaceae bacterium]